MENLFQTTWWEDLLILLFMATFCWSVGLFLFSLMAAVLACTGNYSVGAIVTYWVSFGVFVLIILMGHELEGMFFFILSTPVLNLSMYLMQRDRRKKQNETIHSITHETY